MKLSIFIRIFQGSVVLDCYVLAEINSVLGSVTTVIFPAYKCVFSSTFIHDTTYIIDGGGQ